MVGGVNYLLFEVDISGISFNVYVYWGLIVVLVGSVSYNIEMSSCGS